MSTRSLFFCFFCLFAHLESWGQPTSLFETEEVLQLSLVADWETFVADRSDTAQEYSAVLSYLDGKGQQNLEVEVEVRGNFRRRAEVCDFPPIKLKVPREAALGTPFVGNRKLKMVTHCQEESWVLREYLVYKLFEQWSPYHFRVRLARVSYMAEDGSWQETKYAFLIEDDGHMAERLGGKIIKENLYLGEVDSLALSRLIVFNYLTGNTDWSIYLRKNIRLLSLPNGQAPIPVPYDFDWAAIVGADYTKLGPDFEARRVPPFCAGREIYEPLFAQLKEQEKALLSIIQKFEPLASEDSRPMSSYLRESLRELHKRRTLEDIFLRPCEEVDQ